MNTAMLSSKPVGLVLAGGGAKGAFQAGVWKAMCELGIADRVRVISGTSVGAINGTAFAVLRDPCQVRDLWFRHVDEVVSPNFNLFDLRSLVPTVVNAVCGQPFPFLGLLSRDGLVRILSEVISRPLSDTGIDVYATSLACRGNVMRTFDPAAYELRRFHLNDENSAERVRQRMLASAAIPWGFDPVEIDGVRYVDGAYENAGGDNVPIAPILELHPDIRTIYVIHCNSQQVSPDTDVGRKAKGCKVIEIRPRQTLPGILDAFNFMNSPAFSSWSGVLSFRSEYARRYFDTGYADGLAVLRPSILEAGLNW